MKTKMKLTIITYMQCWAQTDCTSKIRGPPSYFTRLKQGFALSSLKDYMGGYDNIFTLDMPLKTRETNFLILKRQVWTEQKAFYLCPEKGGGIDQTCKLCGDTENTVLDLCLS
jgi:hypothetical protein